MGVRRFMFLSSSGGVFTKSDCWVGSFGKTRAVSNYTKSKSFTSFICVVYRSGTSCKYFMENFLSVACFLHHYHVPVQQKIISSRQNTTTTHSLTHWYTNNSIWLVKDLCYFSHPNIFLTCIWLSKNVVCIGILVVFTLL